MFFRLFTHLAVILALSGCTLLPDKSPTKLEKSPCACGQELNINV